MTFLKKLAFVSALVLGIASAANALPRFNDDDVFRANAERNYVVNPSCRVNTNSYTATVGVLTRGTANKIDDVASCTMNGTNLMEYVETLVMTPDPTLQPGNCVASLMYKGNAYSYSFGLYDGANEIGYVSLTDTGTDWKYVELTTPCKPVTGFKMKLNTDNDTPNPPAFSFGKLYFGKNTNVGTVAQAQFVGAAYFATTGSCSWSRTNATLGAFATVGACPGPTIENAELGSWQTTDADLPRVTINGLPAGIYEVDVSAHVVANDSTSGTMELAVSDGTDIRGSATKYGSDAGNEQGFMTVKAWFRYESSGNRTFELYGAKSAGELGISNGSSDRKTRFVIKKYPLSSQIAVTPDTSAMSWSGYHDTDCAFAVSSTSIADTSADATCTLTERSNSNFGTVTSYLSGSDKLPGIVFTPKRATKYYVCASAPVYGNTADKGVYLELSDLTPTVISSGMKAVERANNQTTIVMCGLYNATSTAAKTIRIRALVDSGSTGSLSGYSVAKTVEWSIIAADQVFPMPVIVNSISTPYNGQAKHTAAQIGGTAYNNVCSASNCAVFNSLGTWINSITINGTGDYTLNFVTGTFPSAAICLTAMGSSSLFGNGSCSMYAQTNTSVSVTCGNLNTASNSFFSVMCDGY